MPTIRLFCDTFLSLTVFGWFVGGARTKDVQELLERLFGLGCYGPFLKEFVK